MAKTGFFLLEENLGLLKYDHGLNDDSNNNTVESDNSHHTKQEERKSGGSSLKPLIETNGHQDNKDTGEQQEDVEDPPKRITRTSTSQNEKESTEVNDPFFALPKTLAKYEASKSSCRRK